jgi:DNA polymerase-1
MSKNDKILLVDGHALLYRAFHALPGLANKDGFPTGAVFGFFSIFLKALSQIKPTHVAVVFDMQGPTFRHELDGDYKAHRKPTPDDLVIQTPKVKELLTALNIPIYQKPGYEADDIVGIISRKTPASMQNIILTGDMDLLQLVNKNTVVYRLKTGITDFVLYDAKKMMQDYGLTPDQWVEYKALKGDASDNIPGVAGIGEKTAIELIKKYQSIENLYKKLEGEQVDLKPNVLNKLVAGKHYAFLSRKLALIDCENYKFEEFNLDRTRVDGYNHAEVVELLQELGIKSLIPKLPSSSANKLNPTNQEKAVNPVKTQGKTYFLLADNTDKIADALAVIKKHNLVAVDVQSTKGRPTEADLVGVAVAVSSTEAYYFPCANTDALAAVKSILENSKIKKLGSDLKTAAVVLHNASIKLDNFFFDTELAGYLINPGLRSYDTETQGFAQFGLRTHALEGYKEKSKFDIPFDAVLVEAAAMYGCEDAAIIYELYPILENGLKDRGLTKIFYEIEMPLVEVLMQMELAGIVLDVKYLNDLSKKTGSEIKKIQSKIYKLAGYEFNVASPAQLREALFDKLKIPVTELKKRGKTGGLSTAANELEKLRGLHPIIDLIFEFRELSKLKSTYLDALPELVSKNDKRLHTNYKQTIAATGRLSSTDPNLQNIPVRTELGRSIRKGFTAAPGYVLAAVDYSQIELRIAASITGDPEMTKIFKSGKDFHVATAARIFNVMEPSVTYEQRRDAKTINFSVLYGVSSFGLSERSDMSRTEAGDFIKRYYQVFAKLKEYIDTTIEKVHKDGYVKNALGRIRYFPEINASNFAVRAGAERAAFNMPIQSLQADIIKMAMIQIQKEVVSEDCRMLLQVHDELVFEIKKGKEKACVKKIKDIMESVYKLKVPVVAEAKVGKNWLEMDRI